MLRQIVMKLRSFFVDSSEVSAYRSMIPRRVSIRYKLDGGTYIAYVEKVDDQDIKGLLITEARTPEELEDNLNQLIYMNAKIPEKVRPYYGNEFSLTSLMGSNGKLVLEKA